MNSYKAAFQWPESQHLFWSMLTSFFCFSYCTVDLSIRLAFMCAFCNLCVWKSYFSQWSYKLFECKEFDISLKWDILILYL